MFSATNLLYVFLPYTVMSLVLYYLALHGKKSSKKNEKPKNALIITAHPDDECMFFAPTIMQLVKEANTDVYLLCLSTGNYNQLGAVREKEVLESCNILGIQDSKRITVLNDEKIQDDPDTVWDKDVVSQYILEHTKKLDIDMIFTFDGFGVSGHKNHIACYGAVRDLMESHQLPKGIKLYFLQSVSIIRKYVWFIDIPFSMLLSRHMFIASPSDIWKGMRAMQAHSSQLSWFRVLYVIFSRYMIVNGYHKKGMH